MLVFKEYNANPKGKKVNDCVIRAIAYASSQTWEKVFEDLNRIALKNAMVFNDKKVYESYLDDLGFTKMPQPKKSNGTKYLVKEIEKVVDTKKYDIVITMASHLSCVDGEFLIDSWNCGNKCIGNYFVRKRGGLPNALRPTNNIKQKKTRIL